MGLWWGLAAISVAAIVYYWIRSDWSLSQSRRVLITFLLALGVAGPLFIVLNPIWIERGATQTRQADA